LIDEENGPFYLWYIQLPGGKPPVPLGVYAEPPPSEMTAVSTIRVGNSKIAAGAHWISSRMNDAARVAQLIPSWPGNLPP
jgi:hypothetical protein